ncbi:MAG: hypothetical protein FJ368_00970 [Pelagibacterales bacterium]|nr:hypothetical protein [Pelagibacterales bacterium]
MPQFDPTTIDADSSQIFWFLFCFAILYYFVSNVILPRIRDIIKERQAVIANDIALGNSLEKQIEELQRKTDSILKESSKNYQEKIDAATKSANATREKLLQELKEEIEKKTNKSKEEIKNFVSESKTKSDSVIQDLTKTIKEKLFN